MGGLRFRDLGFRVWGLGFGDFWFWVLGVGSDVHLIPHLFSEALFWLLRPLHCLRIPLTETGLPHDGCCHTTAVRQCEVDL